MIREILVMLGCTVLGWFAHDAWISKFPAHTKHVVVQEEEWKPITNSQIKVLDWRNKK